MPTIKITVRVKPNSKKGPLLEKQDQQYTAYVPEPSIEGRANQATIQLLALHFNVAKSQVQLVGGLKSRIKVFQIDQ